MRVLLFACTYVKSCCSAALSVEMLFQVDLVLAFSLKYECNLAGVEFPE